MVHIGIELRVETKVTEYYAQRHNHYCRYLARRDSIDKSRKRRSVVVTIVDLYSRFHNIDLWKKDDDKDDCAHEHQRTKQTQIANSNSFQRNKSEEGANSCNIADEQRSNKVFQCSSVIIFLQVTHIVKRIVDGNAYDNRCDAHYDERNVAAQQPHTSQGKEKTKGCSDGNEKQRTKIMKGEEQKQ